MSISEAIEFMDRLELTPTQAKIAELVVKEIKNRLSFLNHVGLSYLTLDRLACWTWSWCPWRTNCCGWNTGRNHEK